MTLVRTSCDRNIGKFLPSQFRPAKRTDRETGPLRQTSSGPNGGRSAGATGVLLWHDHDVNDRRELHLNGQTSPRRLSHLTELATSGSEPAL